LVLDRANRGRSGVWDEVQAIANQLGQSSGFAALLIVGETGLARSLASSRSSVGLVCQLRAHIHLKPLDLDEARDLLDSADLADVADREMLEEIHRSSRGNIASLLRLAPAWTNRHRSVARSAADQFGRSGDLGLNRSSLAPSQQQRNSSGEAQPDSSREVVEEQAGSTSRAGRGLARSDVPAVVPSRPPIRDEDGLVEVGWDGDFDDGTDGGSASADPAAFGSDLSTLDSESTDDRFAALTAEAELTRNEAWPPSGSLAPSGQRSDESPEKADAPARTSDSTASVPPGGIRVEGQHEFAPYGQLFTRYRQSN
jgi:hypothetical protein